MKTSFNYVLTRKGFLCLCFWLMISGAYAQSSAFWEFSRPGSNVFFKEIIATSNSELVGVLQEQRMGRVSQVAIRMDTVGNVLWAHRFDRPGQYYFEDIAELSNGDLVFGGKTDYATISLDSVIVVSLAANGNMNWSKELQSTTSVRYGYNGMGARDGFSIQLGYSRRVNGGAITEYIANYASYGTSMTWRQSYSRSPGFAHAKGQGGNFFVGGIGGTASDPALSLTKLSASGGRFWRYLYNRTGLESLQNIMVDSQGDVYLVGRSCSSSCSAPNAGGYIVKVNGSNGTVIWAKIYSSGVAQEIRSIHEWGTNQLVALGQRGNEVMLLGLDAIGDTLWTKKLSLVSTTLGGAVIGNRFYTAGAGIGFGSALVHRGSFSGTINCPVQEGPLSVRPIAVTNTRSLENPGVGQTNIDLLTNASFSVSNFAGLTMADACMPPGSTACPVNIPDSVVACSSVAGNNVLCVPIRIDSAFSPGILGLEFTMSFPGALVQPTGNWVAGSAAGGAGTYGFQNANDSLRIIMYSNGPASFPGNGELLCVQFQLQNAYTSGTNLTFGVHGLQVNGPLGTTYLCANSGVWSIQNDSVLSGKIVYQGNQNLHVMYDSLNPGAFPPTDIVGHNSAQTAIGPTLRPSMNGEFEHHIADGEWLSIFRDVPNSGNPCTINPSVLNSQDLVQLSRIALGTPAFIPDVYQMLAADVNLNGVVNSGDLGALQRRLLQIDCEYSQTLTPSRDWRFIDDTLVLQDPRYTISTAYPACTGPTGYDRCNVPPYESLLPVRRQSLSQTCVEIPDMVYHGILLGDVVTSWNNNMKTAAADSVVLDFSQAFRQGAQLYVPVQVFGVDTLESMDIQFDFAQAAISSVTSDTAGTGMRLWTGGNTTNSNHYIFASYSTRIEGSAVHQPTVFYFVFDLVGNCLDASDLMNVTSFVNGVGTTIEVRGTSCLVGLDGQSGAAVSVAPNPFGATLSIRYGNAPVPIKRLRLFDVFGKLQMEIPVLKEGETIIQVDHLAKGVYFLEVNGSQTIKLIH